MPFFFTSSLPALFTANYFHLFSSYLYDLLNRSFLSLDILLQMLVFLLNCDLVFSKTLLFYSIKEKITNISEPLFWFLVPISTYGEKLKLILDCNKD